jgi:glyoxylase-like metal-dependent hydrolase (beta-lactamase superfamily II)
VSTALARDLGDGIVQLSTDYPEVCNAPLWTYAIVDDGHYGLVDPGIRSTLSSYLEAGLGEIGLTIKDAELALATHGHPDHSGGQSSWEEVSPGIRIAAPLADTTWIESFEHQWTQFWDSYPGVLDNSPSRAFLESLCVPEPSVNELLRDGDVVELGSRRISVIETRGHTWGHCAYFDATSQTLFTGDALAGHGTTSSDGSTVFVPLYLHVEDTRWGLRRLLDVPFERLCPAHGDPLDRDQGLAFIHESLAFIDEMDDLARSYVERHGGTALLTKGLADEIGRKCGAEPSVTPQSVPTARAHLDHLARQGLIESAWIRSGA